MEEDVVDEGYSDNYDNDKEGDFEDEFDAGSGKESNIPANHVEPTNIEIKSTPKLMKAK